MGRRGRPPFPDILTPREWEVLALLRENLTNEAIAARLGVTHAAAKYHVSEILSKLGVATREEAAAWEPVPGRRPWWAAGLAWLRPVTVGKAALIGAAVAVVAGLGVLAWGVVRDAEDEDATAVPIPTAGVGPEIAFAGEDGRLVFVSGDGAQRQVGVPCSDAIYWSPDGTHLACQTRSETNATTITILDPQGHVLSEFDAGSSLSGLNAIAWAPDGQRFAYEVVDAADPSVSDFLVRNFSGEVISSVAVAYDPVWLPDGRLVAYRPAAASIGEPTAGIDIYVGNEARFLPVGDYRPIAPVLGGSGLLVAGDSTEGVLPPPPSFDAYVLDLATRALRRVPALDNQQRIWVSPDGRYAVYNTPSKTEEHHLWYISLETLEASPITRSRITFPSEFVPEGHVAFSADSSTVYWADADYPLNIFRAAPPAGGAEQLASIANAGTLQFSSDLSRVAYITAGSPPELWASSIDGSGARNLGPVFNAFAWRPLP